MVRTPDTELSAFSSNPPDRCWSTVRVWGLLPNRASAVRCIRARTGDAGLSCSLDLVDNVAYHAVEFPHFCSREGKPGGSGKGNGAAPAGLVEQGGDAATCADAGCEHRRGGVRPPREGVTGRSRQGNRCLRLGVGGRLSLVPVWGRLDWNRGPEQKWWKGRGFTKT